MFVTPFVNLNNWIEQGLHSYRLDILTTDGWMDRVCKSRVHARALDLQTLQSVSCSNSRTGLQKWGAGGSLCWSLAVCGAMFVYCCRYIFCSCRSVRYVRTFLVLSYLYDMRQRTKLQTWDAGDHVVEQAELTKIYIPIAWTYWLLMDGWIGFVNHGCTPERWIYKPHSQSVVQNHERSVRLELICA